MLTNPKDWSAFLSPYNSAAPTSAFYRGTRYTLSIANAPSVALSVRDAVPGPVPDLASNSILFTAMPRLFHVSSPRLLAPDQLVARNHDDLAMYLPSLSPLKASGNDYLDDVLPDRVELLPQDLQRTRQELLPFFLGGGREGLWSSLRMSESVARLATGQKVNIRLERPTAGKASEPMPAPISNPQWRLHNLVEPLIMVGERSPSLPNVGKLTSTAPGLAEVVEAAAPKGTTYKAMFKTGTLDERETNVFESEMLMFVVGRWDGSSFVPGETVSGYLYMSDTKTKADHQWQRGDLAAPILEKLVQYLATRKAVAPAGSVKPPTARPSAPTTKRP
jgi:hypothetical protein